MSTVPRERNHRTAPWRTRPESASADRPTPREARLAGIDGLRAAAALWVVLFHMRAFSGARLWPGVDAFVRSGSTGVSLFLVLSGFCLYMPFAGGRQDRFRTGGFLRRRCRRLLPAYLVTLGLLVVAYAVADGRYGLPAYAPGALAVQAVTHLTLTHQFFPGTFYGLDGAYWSLGLEWELYLTLPLLIACCRRFRVVRTVMGITVVTVCYRLALFAAVHVGLLSASSPVSLVVLPNLFLGRWSEFGMGMLAAELYRSGCAREWARRASPWAVLAALVAFAVPGNPLNHVLFGVVFATLVCAVVGGSRGVRTVFSWTPLVKVGIASYSLYLVHQPLVEVFAAVLSGSGTSPAQVFARLLAMLPVLLVCAWALFMTVERYSLGPTSRPAPRSRRFRFHPPVAADRSPESPPRPSMLRQGGTDEESTVLGSRGPAS